MSCTLRRDQRGALNGDEPPGSVRVELYKRYTIYLYLTQRRAPYRVVPVYLHSPFSGTVHRQAVAPKLWKRHCQIKDCLNAFDGVLTVTHPAHPDPKTTWHSNGTQVHRTVGAARRPDEAERRILPAAQVRARYERARKERACRARGREAAP